MPCISYRLLMSSKFLNFPSLRSMLRIHFIPFPNHIGRNRFYQWKLDCPTEDDKWYLLAFQYSHTCFQNEFIIFSIAVFLITPPVGIRVILSASLSPETLRWGFLTILSTQVNFTAWSYSTPSVLLYPLFSYYWVSKDLLILFFLSANVDFKNSFWIIILRYIVEGSWHIQWKAKSF